MSAPARTSPWRQLAAALAEPQGGVVGRRQLRAAGVPRWVVTAELRAGRWRRLGSQTVAVHNGPVDPLGLRWHAVLAGGPRAALDGVSSLLHQGLTGYEEPRVHVLVPRGAHYRRVPGVVFHESRMWSEADVVERGGLRCTRADVAAVHGSLWAVTPAQASLVLVLSVQQRCTTPAALVRRLGRLRRHRWRSEVRLTLARLLAGAETLSEIDVVAGLERRGLPVPQSQTLRRRPGGRQYLDLDFGGWQVTLEIDGVQHDEAEHRLGDLLRDIGLMADGRAVVRISVLAWALGSERVLDALEELFTARGWRRAAAA